MAPGNLSLPGAPRTPPRILNLEALAVGGVRRLGLPRDPPKLDYHPGMADTGDREARRLECKNRLDRCTDHKRLSDPRAGAAQGLLEELRQIYDLATFEPALERAFVGLVAYRYAHVLLHLRGDDPASLKTAEGLLYEAARSRALAPWPRVYRVAVLGRLLHHGGASRQTLETAFRTAVDHLRQPAAGEGGPLQSGDLNALEACGYALGLETRLLDGHSVRAELHEGTASVLSPDSRTGRVLLPWLSAVEEMEQRGERHPDALLFRLRGPPHQVADIRLPGQGWSRGAPQVLELLSDLLMRRYPRRAALAEDAPNSATARQRLRRLRALLSRAFEEPGVDLLADAPEGRLRFAEQVRIYGAYEG